MNAYGQNALELLKLLCNEIEDEKIKLIEEAKILPLVECSMSREWYLTREVRISAKVWVKKNSRGCSTEVLGAGNSWLRDLPQQALAFTNGHPKKILRVVRRLECVIQWIRARREGIKRARAHLIEQQREALNSLESELAFRKIQRL